MFSILTNIVAFIPLMFIPGETGKVWSPLPLVVIIVFAVSLVEALYVLPAHLAHTRMDQPRTPPGRALHRAQLQKIPSCTHRDDPCMQTAHNLTSKSAVARCMVTQGHRHVVCSVLKLGRRAV